MGLKTSGAIKEARRQPSHPSDWDVSLGTSQCTWRDPSGPATFGDGLLAGAGAGVFASALTLPAVLLTLLLVAMAALAKGLPIPSWTSFFLDGLLPLLGFMGLGGLMIGLIILGVSMRKCMIAVTVDAVAETFSYTESRPVFRPRSFSVPFAQIVSVTPWVHSGYPGHGEYHVAFLDTGGKQRVVRFGRHPDEVAMAPYTEWLTKLFGERVLAVDYFDG